MINNDRQLAVAERKLAELESAATALDEEGAAVYRDLAQELRSKIESYVAARDGVNHVFDVRSVDDLGTAAIYARVAKGWTQKRLAEELEVSEQMVQKDEARQYEKAGVAKLAEVLDVLGYELVGVVRPVGFGQTAANSVSFVTAVGWADAFLPLVTSSEAVVEQAGRSIGPLVTAIGYRGEPMFSAGFCMFNGGSPEQTWQPLTHGRLSMLIEPANLRITRNSLDYEAGGRTATGSAR